MLYNIQNWADKDNIKYKGKHIPIVRADLKESNLALQKEGIFATQSSLPRVYFYLKGKYYLYEENFQDNFFLHFVNRHIYPIVFLKTKKDIDNFINVTKEWEENTPFDTLVCS